MSTLTAAAIADLHARRTAKGVGYAPSLAECLDAAREGRLFDVDTASAGHDGLTIADDAERALAEWAAATVGPVDGEGDAARFARWTAERVVLSAATLRPVFAVRLDPTTGAVCEGFERLDGTASTRDEAVAVARAEGFAVVTEGGLVERTPGEVVGEESDVWTVTVEGA